MRAERLSKRTQRLKQWQCQEHCPVSLWRTIRASRLTLLLVHPESIRRVMRARRRRNKKKSANYCASLRELAPETMRVEVAFGALWRSRAMAACSEPSKVLWRGGSLMKCAATPDSATTQFSFLTDQIKLSVNCPRK